jgi:hypothetical protein
MNTKITAFIVIVFLSVGFLGCNREAPQGLAGPEGEAGPAGPKGPQGPKGPKGIGGNGVANVEYSDWITDLKVAYTHGSFDVGEIKTDNITPEVVARGNVIVYFKDPNSGGVYKLDYYTDEMSITQRINVGILYIYCSVNFVKKGLAFRYIIIPPTNSEATSKSESVPNFSNYASVCKYYNIKE